MRLGSRQNQILNLLIAAKDEYLTSDMIANRVGVTNKTVQSDISVINDNLQEYPLYIQSERGKGYKVFYEEGAKIDELINSFSEISEFDDADFQCAWLICYLILKGQYVTQREILDTLFISSNQFKLLFNKMIKDLDRHRILVKAVSGLGYTLESDEIYMRYCFIYNLKILYSSEYYLNLLKTAGHFNPNYHIELSRRMIQSSLEACNLIISDPNLDNIYEYIRFMKYRTDQNQLIRYTQINFALEKDLIVISEKIMDQLGFCNRVEAEYLAATLKFLINESSLVSRLVMTDKDAQIIQLINMFFLGRKQLYVEHFNSIDDLQRDITNSILLIVCKNSLGYREIETDLSSFVPDDEFEVAIEYAVLLSFKLEAALRVEFYKDDIYRLATIINSHMKLDIWNEQMHVIIHSNSSLMKRRFLKRKIEILVPNVSVSICDDLKPADYNSQKIIIITDREFNTLCESSEARIGRFASLMHYESIISFILGFYNDIVRSQRRYLNLFHPDNYVVLDVVKRNEVVEYIVEKYHCTVRRKATIQENVYIRESRYFGTVFNGVAYPRIYVDSISEPRIEIIQLKRDVLWMGQPIKLVMAYVLPNSYYHLGVLGKPFFEVSRNINLINSLKNAADFDSFLLYLSKSLG